MAKGVLKASEEVIGILETAAVIDDQGITLSEGLSRAEYVQVNKFLEAAGAKWNKQAKRHIFTRPDARERLESLISDGEVVDEKKAFQAFHTPTEVARELVELADIRPGMRCLEPSAGEGAIAEVMRDAGGEVTCFDIDARKVKTLIGKGFTAFELDFLEYLAGLGDFDRIVMNPPFQRNQDIEHVRHAFDFLKEGGKLLAIMSPGFTFGETRIRREFRDFVAEHGRIVKELPEGTFKESGTNVRTVIVELWK